MARRFFASLRMTEGGRQNDNPTSVTLSVSEGSLLWVSLRFFAALRMTNWGMTVPPPCHPERSEGSLLSMARRFFASLRMTEGGRQNDNPTSVTLSVSEGSLLWVSLRFFAALRMTNWGMTVPPPCHPERSEGSLLSTARRFFASLRMTRAQTKMSSRFPSPCSLKTANRFAKNRTVQGSQAHR